MCPGCDGKGVKIQIRRMGPIVQQTQRTPRLWRDR